MKYADHNIIVQLNTYKIAAMLVEAVGMNGGLEYNDRDKPWVSDNIYYLKIGKFQFSDDRPWKFTHKGYADSDVEEPSYNDYLEKGWRNWVSPYGQTDASMELNPQIDAKGRSGLQTCTGMGVE